MGISPNHAGMPNVGRRGRSRLRVRLAARLRTLSATSTVVLCDLSLTGAKITASSAMRIGQDCELHWDGHVAFGRIVWVRAGHCGIHFERPIAPHVLIATRDHNDEESLPEEVDLFRESARRWVTGESRF